MEGVWIGRNVERVVLRTLLVVNGRRGTVDGEMDKKANEEIPVRLLLPLRLGRTTRLRRTGGGWWWWWRLWRVRGAVVGGGTHTYMGCV